MSGVEPEVHLRISYIGGESVFDLFKERSKLFIRHWRAVLKKSNNVLF